MFLIKIIYQKLSKVKTTSVKKKMSVKNVKLSKWSWSSRTRPRRQRRSGEEKDEEGDEKKPRERASGTDRRSLRSSEHELGRG